MKQKKVNCFIIFLCVIGFSRLQAQTFLNVKEYAGTQTSFGLGDLHKLVFIQGNLTVIQKSGNNTDFPLSDIRLLDFTNTTSLDEFKETGHNRLKLYPNPALEVLRIEYESVGQDDVLIQILDVQGKVIYQKVLPYRSGSNTFDIPVAFFRKGVYVCHLKNGKKIETNRFIKL